MRWSKLSGLLVGSLGAAFVALGGSAPAGAAPIVDPGPPCTTNATVQTPVVCLPAGSGEDEAAPLGTGDTITFSAQIVNNGPAVSDASLVITLPPGLRITPDDEVVRYEQWWLDSGDDSGDTDGTPLTCIASGAGATVTCATGALTQGANVVVSVDLTAQPSGVVGTSGHFTVALEPAAGGPGFEPTQVGATIDYTGIAHLEVTLTPASSAVTVGANANLVATIVNHGPNPAPNSVALGFSLATDFADSHFVITNSATFPQEDPELAIRVQPAASSPDPSPVGFWPVGTIPAGATATVDIAVKAVSVGSDELDVLAGSDAGDPACSGEDDSSCQSTAHADLVALAPVIVPTTPAPTTPAPTTPAPTPTPTPTVTVTRTATVLVVATTTVAEAQPQLANTGYRSGPALGVGLAALLVGSALMMAGRARTRRPATHR